MKLPSSEVKSYQTRHPLSTNVRQALFVIFLLMDSIGSATVPVGCWWKEAKPAPTECDFLIAKSGVVGIAGDVKETSSLALSPDSAVWITHRLKITERFSEKAGTKLGKYLSSHYQEKVAWVEFDFEPLVGLRPWLAPFHRALKKEAAMTKVHYAVPFFSPSAVPGNYWSEKDLNGALDLADGLDIMVYDTGVKTAQEYAKVFLENFKYAQRALSQRPEKRIVLGIPSYPDKTRLHRPETENLAAVAVALQKTTGCPSGLSLAVYAGWTLNEASKADLIQIKKQLSQSCP